MEVLLFDGETETLELFDEVNLRAVNPVAAGGVRPDGHELLDMFVGAGAIESTSCFSSRSLDSTGQSWRRGLRAVRRGRSLVPTSDSEETRGHHRAETDSPQSYSHLSHSFA